MANREAFIPDLNGGEGLELAHWANSTVQTAGRVETRPGKADLGNLSRQKFPPWQMVRKETASYTCAIPSCGNSIYASWIVNTWTWK